MLFKIFSNLIYASENKKFENINVVFWRKKMKVGTTLSLAMHKWQFTSK